MHIDLPLAILPLGTFNLLAKSLEHSNDLETLFNMIKNNKTKFIDLATVNDKIFINHAWIGLYYKILKLRKKHKDSIGKNRLLKILFLICNLFKPLSFYELTLNVNQQKASFRTCLLFISNNETFTNLLDFGEHKTLASGLLYVSILNCKTRWELLMCLVHMLIGKFKSSQYSSHFSTDTFTISSKKDSINIVIDGDLFKLNTPLNFVNHQKKIKVYTL